MSRQPQHSPLLQRLHGITDQQLGDSTETFLRNLGQASAIFIDGIDTSRTRVVCTLLHGNEPSGVRAMYEYLKAGNRPCTNTVFVIASVEAALTEPVFSHRMLPGKRDLNRCFKLPTEDAQGQLAYAILDLLHEVEPECVVDIHNTSGSGPAFGVSICKDQEHLALTSIFTNDLIVTDLRLGALMEFSEKSVPTVTIECGGAMDHPAQIIAQEGLHRLLSSKHVLGQANDTYPINVYHNPIRLETVGDSAVSYGDELESDAVIRLPKQAEKYNYGMLTVDERVGDLAPDGFSRLTARDHLGRECLGEYFEEREQGLYPRHPMKVFMVTTNPRIARTDCLFYFIGCH